MKKEIFEAIEEERDTCPEAFGGPATEAEVIEAEKCLGVKLPPDYKEFLYKYGSGGVGKVIVLGLREAEFVATPSFVEQSLEFRKQLPVEYSKMVVIGVDGAGNPVGFNPSDSTIFVFDFDFGGYHALASSFEEYLDKAINQQLDVQF